MIGTLVFVCLLCLLAFGDVMFSLLVSACREAKRRRVVLLRSGCHAVRYCALSDPRISTIAESSGVRAYRTPSRSAMFGRAAEVTFLLTSEKSLGELRSVTVRVFVGDGCSLVGVSPRRAWLAGSRLRLSPFASLDWSLRCPSRRRARSFRSHHVALTLCSFGGDVAACAHRRPRRLGRTVAQGSRYAIRPHVAL